MKTYNYIEVQQPIGVFYLCAIPANVLLKVVKRSPRSKGGEGVQRDTQQERVNKISRYCSDPDAIFPTPIVVSVEKGAMVKLDEEHHTVVLFEDNGIIGDVIDGQHRLWGIEGSKYADQFILPVVLMFDLTLEEKAYIFSTINSNQRRVDPSLIFDLFEVTKTRSPQKTVHEIARIMNSSESSPFYNRLKMLGKKVENQDKAILSQGTFAKTLLQLISKDVDEDARALKRGDILLPDVRCPFRTYFIDERDDVIVKIIQNCFTALKNVFFKEWNDPKNNILWKTTGFRAVAYALPSIVRKGTRDKELTLAFFEICFSAFREYLAKNEITLTSKDFPGGGEQNQKKLAKILIESVANINLEDYAKNLIETKFADFLEGLGDLDMHEIYDLSQALQGHKESLVFFKCKDDGDRLVITYPYYDASTGLSKSEAKDALKLLEDKYMEGMDADTWYGYQQALEKTLNED